MTPEEQLKELYEEYRYRVGNGLPVDIDIFKRRKRALEIAKELKEKKEGKYG